MDTTSIALLRGVEPKVQDHDEHPTTHKNSRPAWYLWP